MNIKFLSNYLKKRRAKSFYSKWNKFKRILQKYSTKQDDKLQKKYHKTRKYLVREFEYYLELIISTQKKTHRQYLRETLDEFEKCISIYNLKDWDNKVSRKIPEELDCYDYLFLALIEKVNITE